jgi:histidinol dehydrogenase
LAARPRQEDPEELPQTVREIIEAVRVEGDAALARFAEKFDRYKPPSWRISLAERDKRAALTPPSVMAAIDRAISCITAFHRSQISDEMPVSTVRGVTCWRRAVPIERVGLYTPGGTAPLFSTLIMLAIPARVAGCTEIALTTPVRAEGLDPNIAYVAQRLEIDEIYGLGGAQAVAAFAYGTKSVPRVAKICGPGNRFVNEAKLQVAAQGVAIDLPAGPSEVLVIADTAANPLFVAADLLAQAEHGPDSQVVAVVTCANQAYQIEREVERQLGMLPRQSVAAKALESSLVVVLNSLDEALQFANVYAPEHLILSCAEANAESLLPFVRNAGSVFVGYMTPEALGDYASGTNHILPTAGSAVAVSGLSGDAFMKKITFQRATSEGLRALSSTVVEMARAEGLEAHARAVTLRLGGTL